MELAWQMSRHGARFVFEPSAEVVHYAARPFVSWCRNAYQYGSYDVIMERQKAIPAFALACREFHQRRAVNRWLTRACVGRGVVRDAALFGLSTAVLAGDRLGARRVTSFALSSIFNVRYWQGASDELGGPERLFEAIESRGESGFVAVARANRLAAEGGRVPAGAGHADADLGQHAAVAAMGGSHD
jgi:hypothetical protein